MPTGFGWDFKTQYMKNYWEANDWRDWDFQLVIYEKVSDSIVRITLNRPDKRNAFNDRLYEDLSAAMHRANDDPDVRVVIICGAGRGFGAGLCGVATGPALADQYCVGRYGSPLLRSYRRGAPRDREAGCHDTASLDAELWTESRIGSERALRGGQGGGREGARAVRW